MSDEPVIYARMQGRILEIATDRLTLRSSSGSLVAIEDHVRALFTEALEIRLMTVEEAPWILSHHVIAPPLQRAA
ncbi:hypothetical protein [Phreatobacter stygius]|uniref:Uncharacterized protein n=1 Tax=Phreatobacter stygius TaxID=1940610 RepID=A0A4D7AWH6_9HYPH|nr:hypothetical protein [Phreatobacter stygius]QCI64341.1 hypothetical protein E8M01_08920 [Phreatobacter stygius]